MKHALSGVAVEEPLPPDGVVELGGEWYFEEHTPSTGVGNIVADEAPAPASREDVRRSILDLFRTPG